jgi:hypothetical protein
MKRKGENELEAKGDENGQDFSAGKKQKLEKDMDLMEFALSK